jgi:protein involved in polysaccharide export with SLBB domain
MDQIVVGTQMRPPNVVLVEGEVRRPGHFTLETGERLSSVLKRAGGLTDNAFPEGIVLVRESVRKRQQAELERFMASERQRLTAQSASLAAGAAGIGAAAGATGTAAEQQVLALRLQQLEAVATRVELGRVVVQVRSIEALEGTEDDLALEARDRIAIPQPPKTVSIIGAVKNPSTVVYKAGLHLDDYVQQAGGMSEDANKREVYVMRANGATEGTYVRIKDMRPGDTIVVPQKIEAKTPALAMWQSVASIIGSVALTAAGIAVVGR